MTSHLGAYWQPQLFQKQVCATTRSKFFYSSSLTLSSPETLRLFVKARLVSPGVRLEKGSVYSDTYIKIVSGGLLKRKLPFKFL